VRHEATARCSRRRTDRPAQTARGAGDDRLRPATCRSIPSSRCLAPRSSWIASMTQSASRTAGRLFACWNSAAALDDATWLCGAMSARARRGMSAWRSSTARAFVSKMLTASLPSTEAPPSRLRWCCPMTATFRGSTLAPRAPLPPPRAGARAEHAVHQQPCAVSAARRWPLRAGAVGVTRVRPRGSPFFRSTAPATARGERAGSDESAIRSTSLIRTRPAAPAGGGNSGRSGAGGRGPALQRVVTPSQPVDLVTASGETSAVTSRPTSSVGSSAPQHSASASGSHQAWNSE